MPVHTPPVQIPTMPMISISDQEYIHYASNEYDLFVNYLLVQLGFSPGTYTDKYLEILEKRYRKYKYFLTKEIIIDETTKKIIYPFDEEGKSYKVENNLFVPSEYHLSDILMAELNIKANKKFNLIERTPSTFISATDISNFTYCPVSWSISKAYSLPKSKAAVIGTSFHEEHRLINYSKLAKSVNVDRPWYSPTSKMWRFNLNSTTKDMMNDISNSVAVYAGLSQENSTSHYFKGKDIYVGQPDYIFFNHRTKKYFVVEEKFHEASRNTSSPPRNTTFFQNHLNQLLSYIYGILDYEISYGYLVYWEYTYSTNYDIREIKQVISKKINKNHDYQHTNLINIYKEMKQVMKKGKSMFDTSKLSTSKCISCVNYMLCGHKTKQFNEYSFPYSSQYMEIKTIPMPQEVKDAARLWSENKPYSESRPIPRKRTVQEVLDSLGI